MFRTACASMRTHPLVERNAAVAMTSAQQRTPRFAVASAVRKAAVVIALAAVALPASANCYYIYSPSNQLLYRSQTAPVDLSLPLHQGLAALGEGLRMVFTASTSLCEGTFDIVRSYRASPAARQGQAGLRKSAS